MFSNPGKTQATQDKIGEFLSRLNEVCQTAADYGAAEKLTPWVRQAITEYPVIGAFILQDPATLLQWLKIFAPGAMAKYLPTSEVEDRALVVVGQIQERLR